MCCCEFRQESGLTSLGQMRATLQYFSFGSWSRKAGNLQYYACDGLIVYCTTTVRDEKRHLAYVEAYGIASVCVDFTLATRVVAVRVTATSFQTAYYFPYRTSSHIQPVIG